jgi:hypothetical protein
MRHHSLLWRLTWALVLYLLAAAPAEATKIDTSPRPTIILCKSQRFIVQEGSESVALYGYTSAEPIRRFQATGRVNEIDATADEQLLLVACSNGDLGVWNIASGTKLWWRGSSETRLGYIYGAGFAWDGRSLVVGTDGGIAVIFDAGTGRHLGTARFPPGETSVMSAALSPDGSKGALVDLGERLFLFDTATGRMRDTGLKGGWPVRFSADGKYVALRSDNTWAGERLRLVAVNDLTTKDVGRFGHIDRIKPTAGGFLITARVENQYGTTAGAEYQLESGELKELWRLPEKSVEYRADFDPEQLIGVTTDYRLVTRLIDLRTGAVRLTVDNSANYRETLLSYTSRGIGPFVITWGLVAVVTLACLVAGYLLLRRGKARAT